MYHHPTHSTVWGLAHYFSGASRKINLCNNNHYKPQTSKINGSCMSNGGFTATTLRELFTLRAAIISLCNFVITLWLSDTGSLWHSCHIITVSIPSLRTLAPVTPPPSHHPPMGVPFQNIPISLTSLGDRSMTVDIINGLAKCNRANRSELSNRRKGKCPRENILQCQITLGNVNWARMGNYQG